MMTLFLIKKKKKVTLSDENVKFSDVNEIK